MERMGAGELLLPSIDRDGTFEGFDIDLVRKHRVRRHRQERRSAHSRARGERSGRGGREHLRLPREEPSRAHHLPHPRRAYAALSLKGFAMKVALLGNMNNLFFATTRHLRAAGVDAHLFLFDDTPSHFHPSQDTFSLDYQSYTTALPYGTWTTFSSTPASAIAEATRGFDFLIGTGTAPALLHRAGKKLDVFLAYGEDLLFFPGWLGIPDRKTLTTVFTLPYHQRRGIREAAVCIGMTSPRDDALYAKLGIRGKRVTAPVPLLCSLEFSPEKMPEYFDRSHFYKYFKELRDSADLLVFSHSRIVIDKTVNYKGTEKLIAGFASFVKRHPELRTKLAIVEYGPDIARARELIQSLGVAEHVRWFPLMARKEALLGLSLADIACGEFGYSWLFGGAITECIAMGKPMLHYREDSDFAPSDLFPILPAKSAEDIAAQLERWIHDREAVLKVGRDAKSFFDRTLIDAGVNTLVALIEEKRTTGRVDASTIDPSLIATLTKASVVPALGEGALSRVSARLRSLFQKR